MNPRAEALEAPPIRTAGEVWGFSTVPDYRSLLTQSICPAGSRLPDVAEAGCPNQRLPAQQRRRPFSPSALNPDLSSLVAGCCPAAFLPQLRQDPHIPESLSHSIYKHLLLGARSRAMSWARETGKAHPTPAGVLRFKCPCLICLCFGLESSRNALPESFRNFGMK